MTRLAASFLIFVCLATPLRAADFGAAPPGGLRLFVDAGYAKPMNGEFNWLDGSFAGQAGIYFGVTRTLAAEMGAGYYALGSFGEMYFPPGQDFFTSPTSVSMVPITAGMSATFPVADGAKPWVSAALGAYVLHVSSESPYASNYTNTRPGFQLGCGVAFPKARIAPRIGFRYHHRFGDEYGREAGRMNVFTTMVGVQFR